MLRKTKLIQFLEIESPGKEVQLVMIAILSGIINALVLVILNFAAKDFDKPELDAKLFIMFLLCVGIFLVSKRLLTYRITSLVQTAVFRYRGRILDQIREMKLLSYEEIGKTQILSVLSEKTELISQGVHRLADGLPAIVMLICCFIYMATISKAALWISLICIAASIITIYMLVITMGKTMQEALVKETEYFGYMQSVLNGFNELKINQQKMDDLFKNYLNEVSVQAMDKNTQTDIANVNLQLYGQVYFYILMAGIVFVVPQITDLDGDKIMAVTSIVLFILGPIVIIIDMMPSLTKANVAVEFLKKLEEQLIHAKEDNLPYEVPVLKAPDYFDTITFNHLEFSYPAMNGNRSFSVGPFNATIKRGELIFIRGGNGSGKSTFMKLFTGLYFPNSGSIALDHHDIDSTLIAEYRNLFSIIFTDFHLFDRLYGLDNIDETVIQEYLNIMGLEKKTRYKEGRFTNTNLSTGQRKRLALIVALMEDKSIYVFDEVAADQDPEFREYFYDVILQKLKAMNKTVIVVTHDEKYFHHCDRLFVMDMGKLNEEQFSR